MISPLRWCASRFDSNYKMWSNYDSLRSTALANLGARPCRKDWTVVCTQCRPAQCCRQLEVPLSPEECRSGRYLIDQGHLRHHHQAILARNPDGSCAHLRDDLCSIYPERPSACRDYYCCDDGRMLVVWP